MGYGRSYGMSGTAVPEWRQGLEKCKQTMSCTKGRCMAYDDVGKRCTCVKCDSELINRPNSGITPRYGSANARPGRYTNGVAGLSAPKDYYLPGAGSSIDRDVMECKGRMSCTKGNCLVVNRQGHANENPNVVMCSCKPCNRAIPDIDGVMVCPPGQSRRCHNGMCWCSKLVPGTTSVERITASPVSTMPMNGLGESFLESIGNVANLAIIGLAIYGGFCLAKKL